MVIPDPPDPIALSYVPTCAGLLGAGFRALYACAPESFRIGKTTVTLGALFLGGLYGLVIWVLALAHQLSVTAELLPTNGDAVSLAAGAAGIGAILTAPAALAVRRFGRRDIVPEDWTERGAGAGIVLGIVVCLLLPGVR